MKRKSTLSKGLSLLLALLLLTGSLLLLTACQNGADGLSAYEIAVQNGFEGSEAEWLASLKGEDGKDGENGEDGKDGKDGNGSGSSSDTVRDINEALLASVSIYCRFDQKSSSPILGSASSGTSYSAGSGVIYKLDREAGDAYIITNYHVVYGSKNSLNGPISDDIRVYLYGMFFDGTSNMENTGIAAEYIGGSMTYDIAVLKITDSDVLRNSDAKQVKPADSNAVTAGMAALAIGNPEGSGTSITSGIVSVESEYISMLAVDDVTPITLRVIRIDTAVNSGNSGGGLFNADGELIGIVNAKTKKEGVENIGYAIPSNVAVYVADNLIDYCDGKENTQMQKCLVGITVTTTGSRAVYDEESGSITLYDTVTIMEVTETSIAQGVLKAGDILTKLTLDGKEYEIRRQHELTDAVLNARVGSTISLTVLRDGEEVTFTGSFSEADLSAVA